MSKRKDTHSVPHVELAGITGRGKFGPRVRKLPNLAPKSAAVNSDDHHNLGRKRPRVDYDTQDLSQLLQQTYPTTEPISLTSDTRSHNDNSILKFNGSLSGSSIRSMTNDIQGSESRIQSSENNTFDMPYGPVSGIYSQSQTEIPWSFQFFPSLPYPQNAPALGSALKICPGCDARLTTLRTDIMGIPDPALVKRLLATYFALRDNWHGCHIRGLEG